jgi:hypothetical protein
VQLTTLDFYHVPLQIFWFVVCDANFAIHVLLGFELCIQGLLQEAFQLQEGQGWLLEMVCW